MPPCPAVCNNGARDEAHHSTLLPVRIGEREGAGRGGKVWGRWWLKGYGGKAGGVSHVAEVLQ